jgi:hypothetical protein
MSQKRSPSFKRSSPPKNRGNYRRKYDATQQLDRTKLLLREDILTDIENLSKEMRNVEEFKKRRNNINSYLVKIGREGHISKDIDNIVSLINQKIEEMNKLISPENIIYIKKDSIKNLQMQIFYNTLYTRISTVNRFLLEYEQDDLREQIAQETDPEKKKVLETQLSDKELEYKINLFEFDLTA